MAMAWKAALHQRYDVYLWVNDDVDLVDDALECLLRHLDTAESQNGPAVILVGATMDPEFRSTTYSGYRRTSTWYPTRVALVEPSDQTTMPIDTFNGNFVAVTQATVDRIGILDDRFSHALGDFDYGLRASESGIPVMLLPGYFGRCTQRQAPRLTLRNVFSVKGVPPLDWMRFCARHTRWRWLPVVIPAPYVHASMRSVEDSWRQLRPKLPQVG